MITLHFEQGICVFTASGNINGNEILDALNSFVSHPRRIPGMPGIWDVREADLSDLNLIDLKHLADAYAPHIESMAKRVAIIISSQTHYEMAQAWQSASTVSAPQERRIFTNTESAMDWLTVQTQH